MRWFAAHGRDFFWREGPSAVELTPFQVLLTEFLLWKTSARAEPIIKRIVLATPSPQAALRRSQVQWEKRLRPLGLHRRRARCLRALSRELIDEHGGVVPTDPAMLQELTGIGQYAARATACMLAGSRVMPIDANTSRIFGRVFGLEAVHVRVPGPEWDARLASLMPRRSPRRFLWATMDLAAAHCRPRKPQCPSCPIRLECELGRKAI